MPRLIESATTNAAAANQPKKIDESIAICLPAFSLDTANRDEE